MLFPIYEHIVSDLSSMPRVRSAEDARLEIEALRREKVLLSRLREVLARERDRLGGGMRAIAPP